MKLYIPKNVKIGHAQDDYTGCTVLLFPKGATCGIDVRGGAPGTRETDLLKSEKSVQEVNAVVLSGGSAYGLAASTGVMEFCLENKWGFKALGNKIVPIVTQAVIFDLNDKGYHYPDAKMGKDACNNAIKGTLEFGQVGAGKGATVGKIRGMKYACKSGIGAASIKVAGINVTAVVTVNALGDVYEDGKIIAGAKNNDGTFFDTEKWVEEGHLIDVVKGSNTTIGCIITDAKLTKTQCNNIASCAHDGFARAIKPVHTDYDGDTLYAVSCGNKPVLNIMMIQAAAARAVELAIINAVKSGIGYEVEYTDETDA